MHETVSAFAYDYPLLIKQLLHTPLACSPEQEIVSGDKRYNYVEFSKRIARLAGGLSNLGVKYGDTVAVMDWDTHRYLECFFAVPMMGAVLHTINVRLSPEQILYTINHAQDDVILVHADFMSIIHSIKSRIERPVTFIYLHDEDETPPLQTCTAEYESLINSADGGFDFPDFDEHTTATTFYTTGTTGEPKGVYYSHRQLVLHTLAVLAFYGSTDGSARLHRGDVYMPITPMFHVHAWGFPYIATMMGIKQVYPGRYEPSELLRLIDRESVSFSHCVPTILHMLLGAPECQGMDFSRWKVVIGGSALPEGLAMTAVELGINIFAGYGMSETCPVVTTAEMSGIDEPDTGEEAIALRCKTGRPLYMVDLRVVDNDMNDIPRDGHSTGEVVMRAPWLTNGYTGSQEASDTLWADGYLHTGDVGYIDDTGSLHITDRLKDVIKSGGEWISSLELENIVSLCEGVSEVAAIGIPDDRWGERPMLVVVRADDCRDNFSGADLQHAIQFHVDNGRLPKWAVPDRIEFVDSLDKTSVGKLDKKAMRARYAEQK